jgi:threonyl-tRNA synthetase
MPITNKQNKYANKVLKRLLKQKLRVELNDKSEKMNYRIREAEVQKAPYIIIVGKREVDNNTVSVRKHGKGDIGIMKLKDFLNLIKKDLGGND